MLLRERAQVDAGGRA